MRTIRNPKIEACITYLQNSPHLGDRDLLNYIFVIEEKLKKRNCQIADLKHRIKEYQLKIVDHEYREEKRQGRIEINS